MSGPAVFAASRSCRGASGLLLAKRPKTSRGSGHMYDEWGRPRRVSAGRR